MAKSDGAVKDNRDDYKHHYLPSNKELHFKKWYILSLFKVDKTCTVKDIIIKRKISNGIWATLT